MTSEHPDLPPDFQCWKQQSDDASGGGGNGSADDGDNDADDDDHDDDDNNDDNNGDDRQMGRRNTKPFDEINSASLKLLLLSRCYCCL